ncbi:MAG: class I fructose-bisphosphate aldolase [Candidatus Margulisiibacteriota bacterium]|nr:MAG: fructose-bisphosphate aldolase [Candidatus Margulisbacteria bacterium GWD2_39_127]OGI03194.1 MAG: fructose-bisphosphate aldolase [Candidatus Margulisbacteria bacterium GWF2_38_17]OGI11218.1 MAG: fructose-bisphosphate aldolase [Candidatus Margulisbacteria bacterium GWE2_39_32]PZM78567.1 MAG: class I fructose-bisphosphate aldolase [Candidatus Margulisiibacteriota bacterium]HAR63866.1 class I fructose-bisphosphate aldolase [Candidatus Margulisiibacteriota bacterium]
MLNRIVALLGSESEDLLNHHCRTVSSDQLHVPGPFFIDKVMSVSDRSPAVLRNMQTIFNAGRLAGTGYLSILPVDQGIEHSAGSAFSPNPEYFDPENIVKLAVESGCNAVASTLGILGAVARKYSHKIPFIVKLNHNELLSYPNKYDQILFGNVDQAFDMGAVAVGATIYFGSSESDRQIQEVSKMFSYAHSLGLVTVLWAYLRNPAFKTSTQDYHFAADLTGQANYLGVTIEADIVKQKLPINNGGFNALKFGKTNEKVYTELSSEHPIDLARYQVVNCFMGRVGLINSGGESAGKEDLAEIVRTAVINKRAGGMGLIIGRKSFQRPMNEGIDLFHTVQDVYLDNEISVA